MKRGLLLTSILLVFLIFIIPTISAVGDLNNDEKVDFADILIVMKWLFNIERTNNASDVNGDGEVNIFDVVIVSRLLGKQYGDDFTAPRIISHRPSASILPLGTTSVVVGVEVNEKAVCRYASSPGVAFDSMTLFERTGGIFNSYNATGLQNNQSYSYYIQCRDEAGNLNSTNYYFNFSVGTAEDSTAPVRSAGSPSGTLAAGTTQTTLSLTTNEAATCKYGTSSGVAYASIANTFSSTGSTSHSATISGLTNGTSYNYYVRCNDTEGNVNTGDYTISFSVASSGSVSVTGVSPESGVPGTQVTITGTGFSNGQEVLVGTTSFDNIIVVDSTTITADVPDVSTTAKGLMNVSVADSALDNAFTMPYFYDDFETGALGASMNGFSWGGFNGKPGASGGVNNATAYAGSYSHFMTYNAAAEGEDSWAERRLAMPELQELWFGYRLFIPSNYAHRPPPSDNNKWWKVVGPTDGGDYRVSALLESYKGDGVDGSLTKARPMWGTNAALGGLASSSWGMANPQGLVSDVELGTWVRWQFHLKVADTAASANGIFQMWKNGTLFINESNLDNGPVTGADVGYNQGYLFGWSNSGYAEATTFRFDEFELYNSDPRW
jgi:hypothetical protein